MKPTEGTLRLVTVDGDGVRFEAEFSSGRIVFDSGANAIAPRPVCALLGAVAACEATDLIEILPKKRQQVTAYEVHMTGERADEHPRRYTAMTLVHRLTGRALSAAAVEESLRLTTEKYCSVYHSIRTDIAITNRYELIEG